MDAIRIRPEIAGMQPYTPNAPLETFAQQVGLPAAQILKLDANENPYGPVPGARAALAALDTVHIYPDPEMRRLRARLSDLLGVGIDYLLVGSGSDELIHLIAQLFLSPGDAVINCPPTFSMYAFHSALAHGRVVNVPRRADFSLDVEAIEQAADLLEAKLLFLCSPNNPDGSLLPRAELDRLLRLPLVIVLDEAYIEFSGQESAAPRVPQTPNLIVLRTFSKWAGLAGLRIGYGVFPLAIIEHLWKIKQPYNVTSAAGAAALASLDELPLLRERAARIVAERARLERELAAVPYLKPYPSHSNFVLCRIEGVSAADLKAALAAQGILLRFFGGPDLPDHVRISAGTPEQGDRLLAALRQWGGTHG